MDGVASRLRDLDGIALALTLIVGYVYVQALRSLVRGFVLPLFQRDLDLPGPLSAGFAPFFEYGYHFEVGGRIFVYGTALEWALTLVLLAGTVWLLARRLGWRR